MRLLMCISLCSIILWTLADPPTAKKVFKYTYDDAGNRIKREFIIATPCNDPDIPDHGDCNSRLKNDTLRDSLLLAAEDVNLSLPDKPTETIKNDGSLQLKNVYPNPTKGLFILEFTNVVINASLEIYDLKGHKLDVLRLDGSQWEIDLSLFPSGTYVLQILTQDGKKYTKKLVKI